VEARPGEVLGTMLHLNRCWQLWSEAVNDFTPQPAGQNKDIPILSHKVTGFPDWEEVNIQKVLDYMLWN